jgi:hypothetical protein
MFAAAGTGVEQFHWHYETLHFVMIPVSIAGLNISTFVWQLRSFQASNKFFGFT